MIIGIDFDNTIVRYDEIFHREAVARDLIPPNVSEAKNAIRDFLRQAGKEHDWTELQGHVYGAAIESAPPYPGVIDCLAQWNRRGFQVCIISHKTRQPVLGPAHDLHRAATNWLIANGIMNEGKTGLTLTDVHFEVTKHAKLHRIVAGGCTHFVDDLPEFLAEDEFPESVHRILFDPDDRSADDDRWQRVGCWQHIANLTD